MKDLSVKFRKFLKGSTRLLAGCGLYFSMSTHWADAATPEVFLPPQKLPLTGALSNASKIVVADINNDGYDDIVILDPDPYASRAASSPYVHSLIVWMNEGKTRAAGEDVKFTELKIPLNFAPLSADNIDAAVLNTPGMDMQVVDMDGDGLLDVLISDTTTGKIMVLWHQTEDAAVPYVYVPDAVDTKTSYTMLSPLSQAAAFGPIWGYPIDVAAAKVDDSGRPGIVAYYGSLITDPARFGSSTKPRSYESFGIIYPLPGTTRGFDLFPQRVKWSGCDLALGGGSPGCAGWNDGMMLGAKLYDFGYSFDAATTGVRRFADVPSDVVVGTDGKFAGLRPNASQGLQVLPGMGANGLDSIWLESMGQTNEFIPDAAQRLLRRRTVVPTLAGNERSAGSTFATLSDGHTVLVTAGGVSVYDAPSNAASVTTGAVPAYLNRKAQLGAWLNYVKLGSGPALLALSDYCRTPDPCVQELGWPHAPLDGSPSVGQWGGSQSLLLLQYAQETSGTLPGSVKLQPFFQTLDNLQAFSVMGGSIGHKPSISAGHFASPTETAILVLDHEDGPLTNANSTHLALFRPDLIGTYRSPTPRVDGVVIGRYIGDGLTDIGSSIKAGEKSAVLIGQNLGLSASDGIRYVIAKDATSKAVKGIFPVTKAETVKDINKEGVVVSGLSTLAIGDYELELHNAQTSAAFTLHVLNPFGIVGTENNDWAAGGACGIQPGTQPDTLYPSAFRIQVEDGFPGDQLQKLRIISDSGSITDIAVGSGLSWDATNKVIVFTVPTDLAAGTYHFFVQANNLWERVPRNWVMTRDLPTLQQCSQRAEIVNHEAFAQCDDTNLYTDPVQYDVWPNLVNSGTIRVFGHGYEQYHIRSAALRQGDMRIFATAVTNVSDNEMHLYFGDLSASGLKAGTAVDLFLYSETADVVQADGVPAIGMKLGWRTPRSGFCVPQFPQITGAPINTGSGPDGTFQAGDVIQVHVKNGIYPVPTAARYLLKSDDGTTYAIGPPRLPDDWYTHSYNNNDVILYFPVPEDLTPYKLTAPISETAELPPGSEADTSLVLRATTAIATTTIGQKALAVLRAHPEVALAAVGVGTTGLSIYYGSKNLVWAKEEIKTLVKGTAPTGITKPGHSADSQPEDSRNVYAVMFVSQPPSSTWGGEIGPVDAVVLRARSAIEALATARSAVIPSFMIANYGVIGKVEGLPSSPVPSLDLVALDANIEAYPPGTNPRGLDLPIRHLRTTIASSCPPWFSSITYEMEGFAPDNNPDAQINSMVWRRKVWQKNNRPVLDRVCSPYFETIGDTLRYESRSLTTTEKNDYTRW